MDWTSFLRQFFLCTGIWTVYFMHGLCVGFPTVLVPQLRKADQIVGIEHTSWLASLYSYCAIPWSLMLSILMVYIGRKKTYIIVCISTLIGFIIFYFSKNINSFYIAAIFHGALASSSSTTGVVILTEYISSNHRGVFLTFKAATFFWGILVANAIGTFFHWKNIVILGLVCSAYTLLNVIIWPESPLWLAAKGKFENCSAAHRWLKGNEEESEKELKELIKLHENRRFVKQKWSVRYLFKMVFRKQFLKPILLSSLLASLYIISGKIIVTVYIIDILKTISSSESTAYSGMLILDCVTVASMYLGCILSKFVRRRIILIGFFSVGITVMVIISIYLYLVSLLVIEENKYLSISLLGLYEISISCGPIIMSPTISGELLPLDSRILSLFIIALTYKITAGTLTKLSPLYFDALGIHGTFLLFAILSTISLVIIYLYVPETKDKTLQEIDDCLKKGEKESVETNNQLISLNRPE